MELGIKSLQHIGIPTTDIGASESFYATLGFEKVMHAGFDHPDGTGTCIMMQLHSILIEIYQFPGAASAPIKIAKMEISTILHLTWKILRKRIKR
jgi:lactoylglutathione lyase